MELIKRKRLLENYRSRQRGTYGQLTASTIDIHIYLTHTYEDSGIYSNAYYEPYDDNYDDVYKLEREDINTPDNFNPAIDGRHPLMGIERYNQSPIKVNGMMDDRYLNVVSSYVLDDEGNPTYTPGLNMSNDINRTFNGVIYENDEEVKYIIGGFPDSRGGWKDGTGISFNTKLNMVAKDLKSDSLYMETYFSHNMGGLRTIRNGDLGPNTSLYALYKEEALLNMVEPPKVRNRVFISRGGEDIFERHAIMSEIKTRNDIDEYRDGYF